MRWVCLTRKFAAQLLVAWFCITVLTSCSQGLAITLWNTTARAYTVGAGKARFLIPAGSSVNFIPARDNGVDFTLESDTGTMCYRMEERPIPSEFASVKRGGTSISLQLVESGKLYLIPPKSVQPMPVPPSQPAGFPIVPRPEPGK
jgi:hypothetical protein